MMKVWNKAKKTISYIETKEIESVKHDAYSADIQNDDDKSKWWK